MHLGSGALQSVSLSFGDFPRSHSTSQVVRRAARIGAFSARSDFYSWEFGEVSQAC